jgi:hypothetical protein
MREFDLFKLTTMNMNPINLLLVNFLVQNARPMLEVHWSKENKERLVQSSKFASEMVMGEEL